LGIPRDWRACVGHSAAGPEIAQRVVALTTRSDPPGEATHWTAGAMAKAVAINVSSAQRLWRVGASPPPTKC
jgi:hypothetical protein